MSEYFEIVYVISSGTGHYKIGRTANLKKRLKGIQTGCPFPLTVIHSFECSEARAVERHLHERFAQQRAEGEWFSLTSDDIAYLLSLGTSRQDPLDNFEDVASDAVGNADFIEYLIENNTPLWGPL